MDGQLPTISRKKQKERSERYQRAKQALKEGVVKTYTKAEMAEIARRRSITVEELRREIGDFGRPHLYE